MKQKCISGLTLGLTMSLSLLLPSCFSGARSDTASAASSNLPTKAAFTPSGSSYVSASVSTAEPDDSDYLNLNRQNVHFSDLRADWGWGHNTDCSSVVVGVVDTGVDTDHSDLQANLDQVSGAYGRNFVGTGSSTTDVEDDNSHGTHVAGIIGALGNNGSGGTGICWDAQILSAKVADSSGAAYLSDVVQGMDYLMSNGAKIVNASLGATLQGATLEQHNEIEDIFSSVMDLAESRGALIVAAAGNDGLNADVDRTYPATLSSNYVIAVANNREGNGSSALWSASNYGGGTIHLSAPGTSVWSSLNNGNTGAKTGTSMAAPMVAGTLALMWSYIGSGNIGALQLKDLLLNNVQSHSGALGTPGEFLITGGRLDIGSAMEAASDY